MERLQRNFLWGRSEGVFKHNLVDWKVVCKPIQSGGAGIRQLKIQNEALLGKWLWRFAHEEASLWRKVIVTKYGEEKGGWSTAEGLHTASASLWRCIRRRWPNFHSCISWKMGKGDRILFWNHNWLEVGVLSVAFPEIYAIAADKFALVTDYIIVSGANRFWNVKLRRNMNDWELDSYRLLMELLYSFSIDNIADSLSWKQTKNNEFTVKSFYQYLLGEERRGMNFLGWKYGKLLFQQE